MPEIQAKPCKISWPIVGGNHLLVNANDQPDAQTLEDGF